MASYTVASGERGVRNKQLVASTVDTVTFTDDVGWVEVWSDGAASITFTVDGSTPVVDGNAGEWLPASGSVRRARAPHGSAVVKLISSGTPKYSVTGEGRPDA